MRKPAVNIAVSAARAAGRVLIRFLNRADSLKISEKQKNDFVTEADRAAEKAIVQEIHKAYPDHAILSEEAG
ncbi:MAG: inositol monophosphatase family protein, partial [Xanthomonadales bacterium]|nr:inositol monophosphatase family protein [Xanthomonadales bacterium]